MCDACFGECPICYPHETKECETCGGDGSVYDEDMNVIECPVCEGYGTVVIYS